MSNAGESEEDTDLREIKKSIKFDLRLKRVIGYLRPNPGTSALEGCLKVMFMPLESFGEALQP